jgi:uncharacterized membrane protein
VVILFKKVLLQIHPSNSLMESFIGMAIILILGYFLLLLVLLIRINNKVSDAFNLFTGLNKKFDNLKKQLDANYTTQEEISNKQDDIIEKPPIIKTELEPEKEIIPELEKVEIEIPPVFKDKKPEVKEEKPIPQNVVPKPKTQVRITEKSWFENFKEKNSDLEKFIGENLINKIGILILVLGISFFVKYAIDKNWINEAARVGIGILCGSFVMAIAHRLRKNYKAFSSVMVAGAISIFYFTIYIGFHDYQLFSQVVAFAILVVITIFSSVISLSYNRQELAVLSLIGGFAVPFMVSTGQGNYIVLFSYITLLNIGILGIAFVKRWDLASILSYIFTILLFISWFTKGLSSEAFAHQGAFIFASVFYFLFTILAILYNVRNQGQFTKTDYFILISNTFIYLGIGLTIIDNLGIDLKGLFALMLAVYNLIIATVLYKKFNLDKNATYLLSGLVLTFVTLSIPLQFEGNHITLFWACEGVLLFWLSQKSKMAVFKPSSYIVQALTLISLIMDWVAKNENPVLLLNPLFITGLVVLASFAVIYYLLKSEKSESQFLKPVLYRKTLTVIMLLLAYITGMIEVYTQSYANIENAISAFSLIVSFHFIFTTIVIFFGLKSKENQIRNTVSLMAIMNIIFYMIGLYKVSINELVYNLINGLNTQYAFYFHYIILACLVYFSIILANQMRGNSGLEILKSKIAIWLLVISCVYILSNELIVHGIHFANESNRFKQVASIMNNELYADVSLIKIEINIIKTQIIKIGFPILWGVLSFTLLILGIRRNWKQLRIIALSLLGLTIAKLFLYDINNVSETGKIIAFILLGILILVISFVYQKIKRLVLEDTKINN